MRRYVANGTFSSAELDTCIGWPREPEGKRSYRHCWSFYRGAARAELAAGAAKLALPVVPVRGDRDSNLPVEIVEEGLTEVFAALLELPSRPAP